MFVQSRGATLLSINAGFIGRTPPSAGFALCKNPSITVREARIAGISYEVTFCTWRKSIETRSLIGSDGTSENSRMNPAFELWSLGTQTTCPLFLFCSSVSSRYRARAYEDQCDWRAGIFFESTRNIPCIRLYMNF